MIDLWDVVSDDIIFEQKANKRTHLELRKRKHVLLLATGDIDNQRSRKEPWEYMLRSRLMGEVHVGLRGKILAVAAGHVRIYLYAIS